MKESLKGTLYLHDDSSFQGYLFGAQVSSSGEVVFNTGMVGYPESLTDPSYKGQILVLTYPLIGNYGVPGNEKEHGLLKHFESNSIHIQGLIVGDYCDSYSHWQAQKSLDTWLKEHNIPALTGIDTRALTKKLREHGTMLGKIVVEPHKESSVKLYDPNVVNVVELVSRKKPEVYGSGKKTVVLVDCGAKNNIIRNLMQRKLKVIVVPWNYDFLKNITEKIDGIVVSNGPGDPKMCIPTIAHIKKAIAQKIPIFGICLGNQILALAAGADTYKLKYGHRGQNQPCIELGTQRCYITSQNHGFAVDEKKLSDGWKPWFRNANDDTNEGIMHSSGRFFSVQFHPECTPGPYDTEFLFDKFVEVLK